MNIHNIDNIDNDKEEINIEEKIIHDPYNPENRIIQKVDIEEILKRYGINEPINNIEIYRRAFVHESYVKDSQNKKDNIIAKPDNCIPLYSFSNERLEFLGDGLLECVTKFYLYCRFSKRHDGNEGFMTTKKIAIVKNESIGKIAMEIGLNKWYIISKNAELKQFRYNVKGMGCLFEAFLGSIFLDFNKIDYEKYLSENNDILLCDYVFNAVSGFKAVQRFLVSIFEKHIDWIDVIQNDTNYKNILQVIIQKEFKVVPYYSEIKYKDDNIEIITGFHMGVYLLLVISNNNTSICIENEEILNISLFNSFKEIHNYYEKNNKLILLLGKGFHNSTKKSAEQIACKNAIDEINKWKNNI